MHNHTVLHFTQQHLEAKIFLSPAGTYSEFILHFARLLQLFLMSLQKNNCVCLEKLFFILTLETKWEMEMTMSNIYVQHYFT